MIFLCIVYMYVIAGSAGQRHRQGGSYGSAGSRRACVDRSVVHFQMRPVENGGRLSLETRKPITPIVGSSRKQSAASAICASALVSLLLYFLIFLYYLFLRLSFTSLSRIVNWLQYLLKLVTLFTNCIANAQ